MKLSRYAQLQNIDQAIMKEALKSVDMRRNDVYRVQFRRIQQLEWALGEAVKFIHFVLRVVNFDLRDKVDYTMMETRLQAVLDGKFVGIPK